MAVEDRYLRAAGALLRAPAAWRAFTVEQRALVRDLPVLERRLGRIRAPTTIVAGAADRLVPLASARQLAAQIAGAELIVLDGAGHLMQLRHARRLAAIIAAACR
jgi:pimeloyl-ACP methyl ester carboxylesterase